MNSILRLRVLVPDLNSSHIRKNRIWLRWKKSSRRHWRITFSHSSSLKQGQTQICAWGWTVISKHIQDSSASGWLRWRGKYGNPRRNSFNLIPGKSKMETIDWLPSADRLYKPILTCTFLSWLCSPPSNTIISNNNQLWDGTGPTATTCTLE